MSTLGIFLFTFFLFIATYLLYTAGERHSVRQLRAYIYIEPISLEQLDPSSLISFSFFAINAGNTPAHNATHSGIISIEDHPLRPNFPFPKLPHAGRSRMLINPGVRPQATILATQRFSQDEFVEIFHGHIHGKRLYIFGQTNYIDAFKRKRWIRICYSWQGAPEFIPLAQAGDWQAIANCLGAPGAQPLKFEIANQHNETEERTSCFGASLYCPACPRGGSTRRP